LGKSLSVTASRILGGILGYFNVEYSILIGEGIAVVFNSDDLIMNSVVVN